jgi:uncharacterized membrane protein
MSLLFVVPFVLAQTPSFQPLGLGPSGVQSFAWDASANGTVVVGSYWVPSPNGFATRQLGFRWEAGVFQDLGALNPNAPEVQALGVSDDGTKVVGWSRAVSGFQRPFLWTAATGMQELPNVPGSDAVASDIAPDGNIVVGYFLDSEGYHAFEWNGGAVTILPGLPNGFDAKGQAVCGAGAAFAGSALRSDQSQTATRWTASGIQDLGGLAGVETSYAEGCSNTGSIVVGSSTDSKGNVVGVRWDTGGAHSLGALGGNSSEAHGVSGDGSIVVGGAGLAPVGGVSDFAAFRWTSATGKMEELSKTLENAGVAGPFCDTTPCPAGTWFLELALGVSSDGSAIVGVAQDPNGALQAFRAIVPVAGTTATTGGTSGGACPRGFTQVTLAVSTNSAAGSVTTAQTSSSGTKLTVASGQTGSACFQSNKTLGFQAANSRVADWGGTPTIICKNGNLGQNSCEMQLGTTAQKVTSALR